MILAIQLVIESTRATLNRNFAIKSQKGGMIIEYALVALLISVVAIGIIQAIGLIINQMYVTVNNGIP
ncbi:MAG: Flp family type IVb pilin [Chlorobaculum sp.]|nr:Flp family type IVb pilin [Chlorobaculum sp.]